jgi:hypothetical protein
MKRPNITPGPWTAGNAQTGFPGQVYSGQIEDPHRGKTARIVCNVMGSALPTWRSDLQAIATLPCLLEALEAVAGTPKHGEPEIYDPEFKQNWEEDMGRHAIDQLHSLIDTARAALLKAGYTP